MEEETTEKSLVEKREELVVVSSKTTTKPNQTLRMANFLNPIYSTTFRSLFPKNPKLHPSSLPLTCSDSKTKPVIKVTLRGWRNQSVEWGSWVQHLEPLYGSVWKRAGIYEAIITSTFKFYRDNDVIIGLAEKWCLETNTFVFPWGEATITLEDMMVLGGFSVFGSPVFSSFYQSEELKQIEHKLGTAKSEFISQKAWIRNLMRSGSDIEHETFLSFWLERYVFNDSSAKHQARIFSIATRLAKGEFFALAPAVLASIYRDLGLLKSTLVAAIEFGENENSSTFCSPLQLVQLWALERFPAFQPCPNVIKKGSHPRSALWNWNNLTVRKSSVRSDLDSAAENFHWQPYLAGLHLYKKEEQWIHLGSNPHLVAFALCLRVSELVGLDCIQQYLPHRVARQFGLDQDIPSNIARTDVLPDLAWSNYIRPFSDIEVFVPSKLSKPDVTAGYMDWWNRTGIDSLNRLKDPIFNPVRSNRSSRTRTKSVPQPRIGEPVEGTTHADPVLEPVESTTRADPVIEPVESITQADAAIGKPLNELEEKTDAEARIPISNIEENKNEIRNGVENGDDYSTEIPGMALEARIAAIEKAVAKLKTARV